tara:strand:+ start:2132 stop:2722 length:591 start_codon:yes stop_codon:yes gene_type:complete
MKDNTNEDEILSSQITNHIEIIENHKAEILSSVKIIAKAIAFSLQQGGTIFWCGNGGSAADSQHLAADLVCRFITDREPLRSVALTTDTSILTAISNDYNFDKIFSRQLYALGKKQDLLIVISTSGNSPNINEAILTAQSIGMGAIGLLGKHGGEAAKLLETKIIVPSDSTARTQETHILIGHLIIDLVERKLHLV